MLGSWDGAGECVGAATCAIAADGLFPSASSAEPTML